MARQRQHAGVLPGAVRVDRREPHAPGAVVLRDGLRERRMGTTLQIRFLGADAQEKLPHTLDLLRFARMRGAGEREMVIFELEVVGRTIGDQWQGLKRLRRRAPEGDEVGIARVRDQGARGVHHSDMDAVHRLGAIAAALLDAHGGPEEDSGCCTTLRRYDATLNGATFTRRDALVSSYNVAS